MCSSAGWSDEGDMTFVQSWSRILACGHPFDSVVEVEVDLVQANHHDASPRRPLEAPPPPHHQPHTFTEGDGCGYMLDAQAVTFPMLITARLRGDRCPSYTCRIVARLGVWTRLGRRNRSIRFNAAD